MGSRSVISNRPEFSARFTIEAELELRQALRKEASMFQCAEDLGATRMALSLP